MNVLWETAMDPARIPVELHSWPASSRIILHLYRLSASCYQASRWSSLSGVIIQQQAY